MNQSIKYKCYKYIKIRNNLYETTVSGIWGYSETIMYQPLRHIKFLRPALGCPRIYKFVYFKFLQDIKILL